MSGFCVAATFDGSAVPADVTATMAAAAAHRGAEVSGWDGQGAAAAYLTHEAGAQQPLQRGTLVCVADARFDEWGSLFDEPHPDRSPSAAQIAVAAYLQWGDACAEHLSGDFAFVIFDEEARRLFAARDQMGARTLYYRVEPGRRVLVASEVKQLLAAAGVPRRPNEAALLADIAGLYAVPSMTHYEGIDQLAPAHVLSVDALGHRARRYWDIDHSRRIRHRDVGTYAEQLRELFTTSVRDRLRGERPAGLFLSGGLDSMAIAGVGSRLVGSPGTAPSLRGYSWAFDELAAADERRVSGPLADHLGMAVTDVPGDTSWPLSDLPEGPDEDDPYFHLYEPLFARTLAAARSDGTHVMLTSDRGDEVLGNWVYDDLGLLLSGRLRWLNEDRKALNAQSGKSAAQFVRERLLQPLVTTLWPHYVLPGFRRRMRKAAGARPRPLAPWVPHDAAERFGLRDVMAAAMPIPDVRGHARLQRYMSVFDVISLRIGQLRARTFARFGLQYADPWADRRIAEFVCAVPQWAVQRQGDYKRLGKAAMEGVLPDRFRLHPVQSNLYPLFHRGFNEREVDTVTELLRDSRAAAMGLLDAQAVLREYQTYLGGGEQADDFWFPLTVELWLRRWWD